MMTGMWALYAREVKRFQKIMLDTVFSPLVNVALYLGVFGVVAGDRMVDGISYLAFVYIGLLSMMLINSSFSNPSFAEKKPKSATAAGVRVLASGCPSAAN